MPNDNKPSFFEWLRGKRMGDINLPMEPDSKPDPRLEGTSVLDAFGKAGKGYEALRDNPAFKALRGK